MLAGLRAQLEPGKFWQSHDRLKAIRLLGRQPVDAVEDRRIAEIFVASHALNPVGDSPFDDLKSDMGTSALVRYRKEVTARWPDLVSTKETAQCRQILIDLADRNIERLNAELEVHEQNADANAERTVDRLSFDQSPDGQRIRAYKLKCINGFFRGIETFRKYQGKRQAEGRERKDEYAGLMAKDGGQKIADLGRWAAQMDASDHVPDGSFGVGAGERDSFEPSNDWDALPDPAPQPGCGTGTAGATQSASDSMMADTTLSDGVTLSDDTSAWPVSPFLLFGRYHPAGGPWSLTHLPATRGQTHPT